MSELKVNKISPRSGTDVTLGDSGDTFTLGSGANIAGLTLSDNILFDTASKGIYLGTTSATASNLLDDYEEGTWTPDFTGTTGAPTGVSYSSRVGWYTKVGQLVHVTLFLALTSLTTSPTGTLRISGLPFTALNSTGYRNVGSVGYSQNFTTTDAPSAGYLVQNSSEIRLVVRNSSDARENMNGLVNGSSLSGNEQLFLSATYQTD